MVVVATPARPRASSTRWRPGSRRDRQPDLRDLVAAHVEAVLRAQRRRRRTGTPVSPTVGLTSVTPAGSTVSSSRPTARPGQVARDRTRVAQRQGALAGGAGTSGELQGLRPVVAHEAPQVGQLVDVLAREQPGRALGEQSGAAVHLGLAHASPLDRVRGLGP